MRKVWLNQELILKRLKLLEDSITWMEGLGWRGLAGGTLAGGGWLEGLGWRALAGLGWRGLAGGLALAGGAWLEGLGAWLEGRRGCWF